MKWTAQEYDSQPSAFIDYLLEMLKAEGRAAREANRQK